jgi:4-diphosphocytidyl-2-C-methyl-D-erythritol kinase
VRVYAPAKLNLCLFLGPRRADGLHELCSLFEPLALADSLTVAEAGEAAGSGRRGGGERDGDEVVCPGVEGENLAARALAALRREGWAGPPLRIEIEKRIPVAAGLGGGSADAAAVLRLARDAGGAGLSRRRPEVRAGGAAAADLAGIAAEVGADVPSQLDPGLALVQGAGERIEPLPPPDPHAVVLLPCGGGLSTAAVFAEADRLGIGRSAGELDRLAAELRDAAGAGASPLSYAELLANDLEPAARSLQPEIGEALDALRAAGAPLAFMSGSGPTAVGLFPDLAAARAAATRLEPPPTPHGEAERNSEAIVCAAGRADLEPPR